MHLAHSAVVQYSVIFDFFAHLKSVDLKGITYSDRSNLVTIK